MKPLTEQLASEILRSSSFSLRAARKSQWMHFRNFHASPNIQLSKSDYEWLKNVGREEKPSKNESQQASTAKQEFQQHFRDENGGEWDSYEDMLNALKEEKESYQQQGSFQQKMQSKSTAESMFQRQEKAHPEFATKSQEKILFAERPEEELILEQSSQLIEHDLKQNIMNELYVVDNAESLALKTKETLIPDNVQLGMMTGRIGRQDEMTPSTPQEILQRQMETRNHPIVKEIVASSTRPERVIELVDKLRDEIRLEYLSQEQYQAVFQRHIKAWLELGNPSEAQESYCRYFESWYRLHVQMGALPFLGRPHMQNRELYLKLAMSLGEIGELHMVQKLAQGFWHDYGSHITLYEEALVLLHSVMRAYVKRGEYRQLFEFFTEKFDTIFGRLPVEYDRTANLTPPSEETFQILFDAFFVHKPKYMSGEEIVRLLICYRDELTSSSEERVREWGYKLLEHLVLKEEKCEVALGLFTELFHSPLNKFNPNALLANLYDYQFMLELFAEVGECRMFDSIFHALLTDENIGDVSDAFYALRVKVFSTISAQEGFNKLNTHFKSDHLHALSNHDHLSKRAFYDPSRNLHYIAIVAVSDALLREKNLGLAWKCIDAYENDCSYYSKEVHQYLFTNVIKICLQIDKQEEALEIFKNHFRSPLFASVEDTTEYGLFEDVDEVCVLLIESFLKSGDIDMAVRFLEFMKSPPDFLRSRMNQMRKRLEEV